MEMKEKKKKSIFSLVGKVIVAIIVLSIAINACSGGSSNKESASGTAETVEQVEKEVTTEAEEEPENISEAEDEAEAEGDIDEEAEDAVQQEAVGSILILCTCLKQGFMISSLLNMEKNSRLKQPSTLLIIWKLTGMPTLWLKLRIILRQCICQSRGFMIS